ncbi:ABC transporter substrate-binding protein [Urechidicola croceus]|uniref:ABC transporter substrate-binding protein n=1 Tax=Urechidicola croceus TaxID=1850246 RepID=A0A1D8P5W3_9FLAO|nr:ABC transporter substrate-binding protein [Urechidicola croceus]AOW19983.1 ABC transporter substrate-binding protein [Urechidicola croceus]
MHKKRKNRIVDYLLLVLGCLLIVSCSKSINKFNDSQVFKYNEHSNILSLDPAYAKDISDIWAVNQLFNGLVQLDENLQVQPDIANSWDISDDGKTYTFNLRQDVKFHKSKLFGKDSTRTVKASDFEYSFNRLVSIKNWTMNYLDAFYATNDSTFVIELEKPFPPFLGLLGMKYCSVVPKEAIDYYGNDFRSNPIGTGPFKFKLWIENTKLVLRKNHHYFEVDNNGESLPYLEAVSVTFLPDKQSEFLQFIQGNIDFLNSIDPSYKDDILTVEGNLNPRYATTVNMISGPYLNTEYLGVFMEDTISPTHSELIRKAINYGFDREKMILYLRNGIGTPAVNGFIPKGLPSFNNMDGYTYQPKKAKELIQQYTFETGNSNPEITITTNGQYVDLCEYIQKELQKIGLTTAIDVIPPSTLRQQKAKGELAMFRASWVADYPDAENYLSLFYSENFTPNGPNYTHFKNEQFDKWYEQSITITNSLKRQELYQKMDSLVMDKAPIVPLYYDEVLRFTRKNIEGLGMNPTNMLSLKKVKKV